MKWAILLACLFMLAGSCRGEQFDNPDYKQWARFKPGSMVRLNRVETEVKLKWVKQGDRLIEREVMDSRKEHRSEQTKTLMEINAERAVIEVKVAKMIDGRRVEAEGEKQVILAKVPTAPDQPTREGEEEVKVGEQKIKCRVESSATVHATTSTLVRTWTSDKVPGGVVRYVGAMKTSDSKIGVAQDVVEFVVK